MSRVGAIIIGVVVGAVIGAVIIAVAMLRTSAPAQQPDGNPNIPATSGSTTTPTPTTGDGAACASFYSALDKNPGYAQALTLFQQALDVSRSQPLMGDLQTLVYNFINGIEIWGEEDNVTQDCADLGYPNPVNN